MKFLKHITLLLIIALSISCSSDKKTETKSETKTIVLPKKETKRVLKVEEKSWDSLNRKNTNQFLTAYGNKNKETKVLIKTSFGNIKLQLYNDTPIHRASFIFLTKIGYFDNTVFYRVAKNFVIQGGDSEDFKKSKTRYKYENYLLKPEFRKNRRHRYGALASAREWDDNPNKLSTPFEFYIVQNRNGAHHLNNEHTVFGHVISGFSTINKIANVKVGPGEWPDDDIPMKVEILD
ncbi:peptidylprolyl isomerase [Tenacibaculum todarodis]|uniref:Peptidyl-prolyl cis-trans isomerase n=1 Tax=Tenacibaculum todarodis TaxID=1850252 RepID=A0A1L3JGI4_9FLAO|nr:peptidylprolyl isomerase [Tenacibaculum todarodis]APG64232.1 peptidylprolyl isomerase [Tenacibaculum todarodis]